MFVLMYAVQSAVVVAREDSMIPGTHLQYRTQDQATHTRYVRAYNKEQHPNQKKKTRDTCIQQCTRLLLMGMSVGREFEIHVLCFHFCVRHIPGTHVQ